MKGCLQYLIRLAISVMLLVGLCVAVILLTSCDYPFPGGEEKYKEECENVCGAIGARYVTHFYCGESSLCTSCTCADAQHQLRQFSGYHFQEIEED